MNDTQRKKIIKAELLETFAEIIDTLYGSTMGASGQNHAPGQVPDPGAIAGTSRYLREDGTWQIPAEPEIIKGYLSSGSFYTETQTAVDYVEIGGVKWATMNVGATAVTDTGLYFQWGDTQGYTASQCGSGEGQKYFGWADYKYGNGTSSPSATGMTKYNSSDGKTVLEVSDDAVIANWGGSWRMPTTAEYAALGAAVNSAWATDYQGSGVSGLVLTDKTDSSKVLFFPACGYCNNGSVKNVGSNGSYLSSSLYDSNVQRAYYLLFVSTNTYWKEKSSRSYGFAVRGVWDGQGTPVISLTVQVTPEQNKLYVDTTTNKIYRYDGSNYVEVNSISAMGASGSNHSSGLVPDPGATAGTSKFLCEDGTWKEPSEGSGGGNISVMGGSGSGHASGLVPDPGSVAGTSKYLCEDGTWKEPTGGGASNGAFLGTPGGSAFLAEFDPLTDTVWNKAQVLTSALKELVKINLGLQDIVFNIAYDPVNNKAATMADIPTIPGNATTSAAGLMSAVDKTKLDNTRNITISSSEPTSQDGEDGDIWLVYDAS